MTTKPASAAPPQLPARPWRVDMTNPFRVETAATMENGLEGTRYICTMQPGISPWGHGRAADEARLIVEAVNSHASLLSRVAELEGALRAFIDSDDMGAGQVSRERDLSRARSLLAKKGG